MLTKSQVRLQGLLTKFLFSRRQGLSPHTIAFYRTCLKPLVENYDLMPEGINQFLAGLKCNTGGKLAYFRAIRVFVNWLVRNNYLRDNPLKKVDRGAYRYYDHKRLGQVGIFGNGTEIYSVCYFSG